MSQTAVLDDERTRLEDAVDALEELELAGALRVGHEVVEVAEGERDGLERQVQRLARPLHLWRRLGAREFESVVQPVNCRQIR